MADVFISTSIILLLLFNRRLLPEPVNAETEQPALQSQSEKIH